MPSHGCNGPPAQAFPWTKRPSRHRDSRGAEEGFAKTIKMLNKKSIVAPQPAHRVPASSPWPSRENTLHGAQGPPPVRGGSTKKTGQDSPREILCRASGFRIPRARAIHPDWRRCGVEPSPADNTGLTANRQSKERPGAIASCSTRRRVIPGAVRPGRGRFITVEKDAA